MTLFETFYTSCIMRDKKTRKLPNGGISHDYTDGAEFQCAIVTSASKEQKVAEQAVGTTVYKITTPKNVVLVYHDVFKRLSDGKTFRVTSDAEDVETPNVASFSFHQCTAEEWEETE